jgi:hypothetical protein
VQWQSQINDSDYQKFISLVDRDLRGRGMRPVLGSDSVRVTSPQGRQVTLGLQNLMQLCMSEPQSKWLAVIDTHFGNLVDTMRTQAVARDAMKDFATARSRLLIRIYSEDAVPNDAQQDLICRTDLEGTRTVLMVDLNTAVESVSPAMAQYWGKSRAELFDIALRNTAEQTAVATRQEKTADGARFLIMESDELNASSHVLILNQHPGAIGRYGSIVAIPTRHQVVCHPINDETVAAATQAMAPVVDKLNERGPGATSRNLYWYHDGIFQPLRTTNQGGEAVVQIPTKLSNLLQRDIRTADANGDAIK